MLGLENFYFNENKYNFFLFLSFFFLFFFARRSFDFPSNVNRFAPCFYVLAQMLVIKR